MLEPIYTKTEDISKLIFGREKSRTLKKTLDGMISLIKSDRDFFNRANINIPNFVCEIKKDEIIFDGFTKDFLDKYIERRVTLGRGKSIFSLARDKNNKDVIRAYDDEKTDVRINSNPIKKLLTLLTGKFLKEVSYDTIFKEAIVEGNKFVSSSIKTYSHDEQIKMVGDLKDNFIKRIKEVMEKVAMYDRKKSQICTRSFLDVKSGKSMTLIM